MFEKVILFLVLLVPCMPKIMITEGVTMYPAEILLAVCFPFLAKYIKLPVQKYILYVWIFILLSTIISCFYILNTGGLMRCYKEIIYIPILILAYKNKTLRLKHILYFYIIACLVNYFILVDYGFNLTDYSIWNKELLSSGLSNRYVDLSMNMGILPGGSHGIWLQYNVLCLSISIIAYHIDKVSKYLVGSVIFFFISNLAISASREGLISAFLLVLGCLFSHSVKNGKLKLKGSTIVVLFAIIMLVIGMVSYLGESLGMVQKIMYTVESLNDSGQEQNVTLRLNAWKVFLLSLIEYPYMIIWGYGFNGDYYQSFLSFVPNSIKNNFVAIPESFFVETFMYGGILCFIYGIKFWKSIYIYIQKCTNLKIRYILFGLFWGLLFGNMFSGASIICDVLYSQFLIFMGVIYRYQKRDEMVK